MLHFRLSAFQSVLDAESRECFADGMANQKKEEDEAITTAEEKILWVKNLLGCHCAKSILLHTIYFYERLVSVLRSTEIYDTIIFEQSRMAYFFVRESIENLSWSSQRSKACTTRCKTRVLR